MSYPAYVIAESELPKFIAALLGKPADFEMSGDPEANIVRVERNGQQLFVALTRSPDLEGHILIKWRHKTQLFSSSKELQHLLQEALSQVNAIPVESL